MGERKWRRRDILWIPVETPSLARMARVGALGLAGLAAFIWTVGAFIGFFTPSIYGHWGVVYAILWILVAWGLYKMRPEAATAGFILSFIGFIGVITHGGSYQAIGEAIYVWGFVQAIRGTFAYQRFARLATDAAPGPPQ